MYFSEKPEDTSECSVDDYIGHPWLEEKAFFECRHEDEPIFVSGPAAEFIACYSILECDAIYSLGPVYKKVC